MCTRRHVQIKKSTESDDEVDDGELLSRRLSSRRVERVVDVRGVGVDLSASYTLAKFEPNGKERARQVDVHGKSIESRSSFVEGCCT
jgi:hypothetical protein